MGKGRKLLAAAVSAMLAASLVPVSAFAADASSTADASSFIYELGTYVEHEAIAYVVDGGVQLFSLGDDVLAGAQSLMAIDAEAADEARGGDTVARSGASLLSASADVRAQSGRLVVVRDESKTAEQLVAELEADPRVVFAEPNAVVQSADARDETAALDAANQAVAKDLSDGVTAPDEGEEGTPAKTVSPGAAGTGDSPAESDGDSADEDAGAAADAAVDDAAAASAHAADQLAPVVFGQDKDDPAADINEFMRGFDNNGFVGGVSAGQAVDVDYDDWKAQTPDTSLNNVVVAVMDNGVDATNPDLEPVMWNVNAHPGLLSIEGADQHGFAAGAPSSYDGATMSSNHGTHVAGIVGAAWTGKGMSGLAPNVQIMAVRHNNSMSTMLQCFDYISKAVDAGVNLKVVNCSWTLGRGAWRSVDLAVTQLGDKGVISVFGTGNSTADNDAISNTVTALADNPYVVAVNAIDPDGGVALYSQYGETTTDVMAPGSSVLSTVLKHDPAYLAEEDENALIYQSFDSESSTGKPDGTVLNGSMLSFSWESPAGKDAIETSDTKAFDGDASLALPATSQGANVVVSDPIDLGSVAEKPTNLSIRFSADGDENGAAPSVMLQVKKTDGEFASLGMEKFFGTSGAMWNGYYADLTRVADIDWSEFTLRIGYALATKDVTGGFTGFGPYVDGTVYVDSIGMGSDKVPYNYIHGTSMAAPAVSGIAAVFAGMGAADVAGDKAKSAEKLAALVQAAAVPRTEYAGKCSTGGYATVSGINNLGPVITSVESDGDEALITGYFMSGQTRVTIDGTNAAVSGYVDEGDGKGQLRVALPASFTGGQVTVRVSENGKESRHRADFGPRAEVAYYDQPNLPVPEELDSWGSWQLVGFNGMLYCLPRTTAVDDIAYDFVLCYDPKDGAWAKVSLLVDLIEEAGITNGVTDVSATTWEGSLLVQVTEKDTRKTAFLRYGADGSWASAGISYKPEDALSMLGTLASDGANVYVFGGMMARELETAAVQRINFETGSLEKVGDLPRGRICPQVAYNGETFAVSGGFATSNQMGGAQGADLVTIGADGAKSEAVAFSHLTPETGQLSYASAAVLAVVVAVAAAVLRRR